MPLRTAVGCVTAMEVSLADAAAAGDAGGLLRARGRRLDELDRAIVEPGLDEPGQPLGPDGVSHPVDVLALGLVAPERRGRSESETDHVRRAPCELSPRPSHSRSMGLFETLLTILAVAVVA